MEKIDIAIVGAGVIGLAVAAELSKLYKDIWVIEKNSSFGQETSSRNSEVIHAGIYYPKGSLKAKTCIEGRRLLYEFCLRNNIQHKRIGKLIVAVESNEMAELKRLFRQGWENGVEDLRLLSQDEVKAIEPNIKAKAGIYSPSTGILDTHGFMMALAAQFENEKGQIAYNTELVGMHKTRGGFEVTVKDRKEGLFRFFTRIFINSAGLSSDKVSAMAGLLKNEYELRYCKGDYFRVHNNKAKLICHLIYPVPKKERAGLGIHATLDLAGGLRLGPDDEYVQRLEYNIDASKQQIFYASARQFLPFIQREDIAPDISGIRPKLQGPEEGFRDFIIKEERDNGLPGLINLIGIESPGLTSALSIAKMLREIVERVGQV